MTFIKALGWTLVHSTWEIAMIAGVLFSTTLLWRAAKTKTRYFLSLVALAGCALAPMATYVALVSSAIPVTQPEPAFLPATKLIVAKPAPVPVTRPLAQNPTQIEEKVEPYLPSVVLLWFGGLVVMSLRLLGGVFALERMKRRSSIDLEPKWDLLANSIAQKLGVRRRLILRVSADLDSPAVVGILKSVILLPASVLTKLSPSQMEALLAHEIAHVRRHDFAVNLVQSVIETVMFYHPAVWWISSVVRDEREHCCDDLAVQVVGDPTAYAQTLMRLEELRLSPRFAMAANGGNLLSRIRRLVLGPQRRPVRSSFWVAAAMVLVISAGFANSISAQDVKPLIAHGTVLDPSGHPTVGATIYLQKYNLKLGRQLGDQTLISDSKGEFEFTVAPDDNYQLGAYRAGVGVGFARSAKDLHVVVQLDPSTAVHLRAIDTHGKGLAGIRLQPTFISSRQGGMPIPSLFAKLSGVTDSSGRVVLHDIPKDDYVTFGTPDTRFADVKNYWTPNVKAGFKETTLVFGPPCQVEGMIQFNEVAPSRARVAMIPFAGYPIQTTVSDDQGRFHYDRLPPENFQVMASPIDPVNHRWIAVKKSVTTSPAKAAVVQIDAEPGAGISGAVVDPKGRIVREGAVSILRGVDPRSTETTVGILRDGTFSARLLPGKYFLAVVSVAPRPPTTEVTLATGDEKRVRLTTEHAMTDVECSAVDESGKPVADAQVYLYDRRKFGTQLGQTVLMNTQMSHISIPEESVGHFYGNGFKGNLFSDPQVLPTNGRMVIHLHPAKLSSVGGVVTDTHGHPIPHASVTLGFSGTREFIGDLEEMGPWTQTTSADGRYLFSGLYPTSNPILMATAKGYADFQTETVTLIPGKRKALQPLRLKSASFVNGTVLDQNGKPVEGAQVSVRANQVSDFFKKTDAKGRFHIDRVLPGTYWLDISKGYSEAHLHARTGTDSTYRIKIAPGNQKSTSY